MSSSKPKAAGVLLVEAPNHRALLTRRSLSAGAILELSDDGGPLNANDWAYRA